VESPLIYPHKSLSLTKRSAQAPGKRSEPLGRMCEEYLQKFERRLGGLIAVSAKLESKVELNTSSRDAVSKNNFFLAGLGWVFGLRSVP
jgi:hypothetical protein